MPVSMQGIRSTSAILVPQGGTGANSLESGSLLVGNATGAVGTIAPGSEGQILTVVNGVWAPAANAGGNGGGGAGISAVSSSGNLQGDGTSGSVLTLKDDISLNSVTASYFVGDGSQLTNIVDQSYMTFTATGFTVGDIVALSGSLVKADYSDDTKSNAFGAVSSIVGSTVYVKVFGEVTALSASNYATAGTLVYVGPSGSVVNYSSIPSGKYITQVGIISPTSGKVILQPRIYGQK